VELLLSLLDNSAEKFAPPPEWLKETMKKILIVDDSQAEIKLMQSVLQAAGYWPVAINDPTKIEQTIDAERPSLILLDVVMPNRNGFQACRELKASATYQRIPVVLVSSKSTDSDKFWAKQQGADDYVVKPWKKEALLAVLQRLI